MQQTEAGIRELKSNLSAYLRMVKAGETIVITERGRPIGRLVPLAKSLPERLEDLAQAGLIAWSGRKLRPLTPVARTAPGYSVADLLLEDRE